MNIQKGNRLDTIHHIYQLFKVNYFNMETTHQRALNKFGEQKQKDMAIEEMSELTQALLKERRGRESNVAEEIADVTIVLDQLKLIYPEWKTWEQVKLARLNESL